MQGQLLTNGKICIVDDNKQYGVIHAVRWALSDQTPLEAVLAEEIRVVLHGCLHQLHRSRALKKVTCLS